MLEARVNGGSVEVGFQPGEKFFGGSAHVAWLGFNIVSKVRAGENSGRALRHDFAVLRHSSAQLAASDNGAWTAQLDASQLGVKAGALAVWIEANGVPLQAAGGWLSANAPLSTPGADAKSRR